MKKLILKGYMVYYPTYITFWRRQNYCNGEQMSCLGTRVGGGFDHSGAA